MTLFDTDSVERIRERQAIETWKVGVVADQKRRDKVKGWLWCCVCGILAWACAAAFVVALR